MDDLLVLTVLLLGLVSDARSEAPLHTYLGCFPDFAGLVGVNEWTGNATSPAHCASICAGAGYRFAAIHDKATCACGERVAGERIVTPWVEENCLKFCPYDRALRCGGKGASSVYLVASDRGGDSEAIAIADDGGIVHLPRILHVVDFRPGAAEVSPAAHRAAAIAAVFGGLDAAQQDDWIVNPVVDTHAVGRLIARRFAPAHAATWAALAKGHYTTRQAFAKAAVLSLYGGVAVDAGAAGALARFVPRALRAGGGRGGGRAVLLGQPAAHARQEYADHFRTSFHTLD